MENEKKDIFKQAEKILYDYKYLEPKIKTIELKIKQIENNSTLSSIDYSKEKLSKTNSFSSEVEDEVIRREEKIAKLEKEKNDLIYRKNIIDTFIDTLIEDYKQLVRYRYFNNPKLSWKYGTRHRAAIGLTEISDCACLVVSEETGDVSISMDGTLKKYEDLVTLKTDLEKILNINTETDEKKNSFFNFNTILKK